MSWLLYLWIATGYTYSASGGPGDCWCILSPLASDKEALHCCHLWLDCSSMKLLSPRTSGKRGPTRPCTRSQFLATQSLVCPQVPLSCNSSRSPSRKGSWQPLAVPPAGRLHFSSVLRPSLISLSDHRKQPCMCLGTFSSDGS